MAEARYPIPVDDQDDEPGAGRMGFLDHLDELRKRIIRSCLAIAGGMLVSFAFYDRLGDFVLGPTLKVLPGGLIITKPGEGFAFYLDVCLIGGIVLAAPFVMYQVWRFIAPGLYAKEKRFAIPFVLLTTLGAIAGAAFTHYVMFPATFAFFATFHSKAMKFTPRVEDTFDLYMMMLLGMVVVFQIPTVVFFLAKMRLVTARFLWRNFQYAILIIFIVAAVLTPSADPWNQTIFAAPMLALYVLSIGIAWLVAPRRGKDASIDPKLKLVIGGAMVHAGLTGPRVRNDQARKPRKPHRFGGNSGH
ncbi:MAG: twin-arginine translocase subunit TatC [Acidobacteriia bacterium]|nr:twin-arginine translocase subunit TatC [Terriglobia bacterium]